jgi:hypothetical protein
MIQLDPLIIEIKDRAYQARVPISAVMKRGCVRVATWSDWMRGADPKLSTVRVVQRALEDEIASRS